MFSAMEMEKIGIRISRLKELAVILVSPIKTDGAGATRGHPR
jgi:hypothetical protein